MNEYYPVELGVLPENRSQRRYIKRKFSRVNSVFTALENSFLTAVFKEDPDISYFEIYYTYLQAWHAEYEKFERLQYFDFLKPDPYYFYNKYHPMDSTADSCMSLYHQNRFNNIPGNAVTKITVQYKYLD